MARAMETIEVPMGGMIFNQGDPADALFVVRSGVIEIVRDAGLPTSRRLATLSEKEYFGEMGIIERAPRSASARAAVRSTLLKLSRETAVNLFRKHPSIELRLRTAILRRHSENIAGMARKK
jgi:NTE family protein